jgi:predicted Zn-dependent peptidase
MISQKKITLKNGTRVFLVPNDAIESVTLLALYEVGSRYETAELNGASHFVEHMCFKGTKRRPDTSALSRDLDSVGADYNAFTNKDHTGYYIKLSSDRLDLAADMLEDMVYHSLYRPDDIESEKGVITEELRMYEDNPMMRVDELLEEEMFGGSTLGWRIGGTVESVSRLTRDGLVGYWKSRYRPSRTVIAVAGKFDEDEAVSLLRKKFGSKAEPSARPASFRGWRGGVERPRARLEHKDTEQVQVAIGFPSFPYGDKRLASLSVLSAILGGGMSSRLFIEVREKHGLAYSIRSGNNPYQDTGYFSIQAGLAKDRVHEAMNLIMSELVKVKARGVTVEEMSRAKEFIRGRTTLALEDSSRMADWFARQELLERRSETPEEKLKKIFAVGRDDVRRLANWLFRANRPVIAAIGPFSDPKEFVRHAGDLK